MFFGHLIQHQLLEPKLAYQKNNSSCPYSSHITCLCGMFICWKMTPSKGTIHISILHPSLQARHCKSIRSCPKRQSPCSTSPYLIVSWQDDRGSHPAPLNGICQGLCNWTLPQLSRSKIQVQRLPVPAYICWTGFPMLLPVLYSLHPMPRHQHCTYENCAQSAHSPPRPVGCQGKAVSGPLRQWHGGTCRAGRRMSQRETSCVHVDFAQYPCTLHGLLVHHQQAFDWRTQSSDTQSWNLIMTRIAGSSNWISKE